ncbi:uncharacterized protein HKW66_Vig0147740 [Vigna angularis]|nr:uncharacterized protein HKW66_Vig0147740 [Vigna angularis]
MLNALSKIFSLSMGFSITFILIALSHYGHNDEGTTIRLPYALLVSRILEYKGVDTDGENSCAIQAVGSEIEETTLQQMGFIARANSFVHKDEVDNDDEDDDIDAHMA